MLVPAAAGSQVIYRDVNPNPRGWLSPTGNTYVDLGEVQFADFDGRDTDEMRVIRLWMRGAQTAWHIRYSEETAGSLRAALAAYGSGA